MSNLARISSVQNPLVKQILELQAKSRERAKQQKFIVEGLNEIRLCLAAGFFIDQILYSEENIPLNVLGKTLGERSEKVKFTEVSGPVFEKIAYREDVENAVAIVRTRITKPEDLNIGNDALVLVAEGIEKPGNLGAILRSADAMGVAAVIIANPKCDIYNPNVIRGSVGSVFAIPIVTCSNEDANEFLRRGKFTIFTTFMESAVPVWDVKFESKSAILVGTENSGLSEFWRNENYRNVNIPMHGKVDSLNVSVAVSLLLYEAVRQIKKTINIE